MVDQGVPAFADETIAVKGGAFDDLVPDTQSLDEIREDLRTGNFGAIDVTDFRDFHAVAETPAAGEYQFSVEQRHLREATTTTKATTSRAGVQFGSVRVTVFPNKLKVATFNQITFSEMVLALAAPSNVEEGKPIAFNFDHERLNNIATTFPDAITTFLYNAEKSLLVIRSGDTHLELSTLPENAMADYHAKIGPSKPLGKMPTAMVRRAGEYAGQFARRDDVTPNLSLIDFRGGQCLGGSKAVIGVFDADLLSGVTVGIKHEILKTFDTMLARLSPDNTHLHETDTYYILRDENLYFGFEKTQYKFPPVQSFFANKIPDHVLIVRTQLLAALNRLAVVSSERDLQVHLKLEGSGKDASLSLITSDITGKNSRSSLVVSRFANEGQKSDFPAHELFVNISEFARVVKHFQSANVHIEVMANNTKRALLVIDEGEGFTARTILNALSAEAVAKMRDKPAEA